MRAVTEASSGSGIEVAALGDIPDTVRFGPDPSCRYHPVRQNIQHVVGARGQRA